MLARETTKRLLGALLALPAAEAKAIAVAFFGQRSYCQVAEILGEAEGTVKARIRAGLRRLGPSPG